MLTQKPSGWFSQAETENYPRVRFWVKMQVPFLISSSGIFSHFCYTLIFIYKQLGSSLSLQSCLYFQVFLVSKLHNGFLVVWPSKLCLRGIQQFQGSKSAFIICYLKIIPKRFLRQLNVCVLSAWQLFFVYCKGKTSFSFNM